MGLMLRSDPGSSDKWTSRRLRKCLVPVIDMSLWLSATSFFLCSLVTTLRADDTEALESSLPSSHQALADRFLSGRCASVVRHSLLGSIRSDRVNPESVKWVTLLAALEAPPTSPGPSIRQAVFASDRKCRLKKRCSLPSPVRSARLNQAANPRPAATTAHRRLGVDAEYRNAIL